MGAASEERRGRSRSARRNGGAEKRADKEAAPEFALAPDEFMVSLVMVEGVKLGLDVDWRDGRTLFIKNVLAGAVANWNKEVKPNQAVHAGDRVIAINGHFDDPKAMLNECRTQKKLQLLVRTPRDLSSKSAKVGAKETAAQEQSQSDAKAVATTPAVTTPAKPVEWLVTLDMVGQTMLGLDVDWADGKTLYIKSLQAGAVQAWNRTRPSEQTVQPGARVLAVNGYSDDPEAMASLCRELCSAQSRIHLRVRGLPLPPPLRDQAVKEEGERKEKKDKEEKENKKEKKKDKKDK